MNLIIISIYFFILMFLIMMILMKKINNKISNFNLTMSIECGFNNFNNKHISLYMNFFLILIIFMIFDLEFFLFMPIIILMKNLNWKKIIIMLIFSSLFMYFSLMYEIKFNSMKWIK